MQCHVLGITLLPIVGALLVADVRRREASERRAVIRIGLAGLGLIALTFVPLVIHELTTGFSEVEAALAYFRSGGDPPSEGPLVRFVLIEARVVTWPLVGLIVDGVTAAMVALVVVSAIAVWRSIAGSGDERTVARWLGLGLLWTAVALTFAAPSLATVIRGLPNDHYHAFADPMVFVLVGLGAAALWEGLRGATRPAALARPSELVATLAAGRTLAVVGVGVMVAWAVTHQPPAVHPDGGFPAAAAAAARIESSTGPGPIRLLAIPDFKSVESYAYPLVRGGRVLERGEVISEGMVITEGAAPAEPGSLVVICDSLFEVVIGAACGGPAEAAVVPADLGDPIDRFEAAPGRWISTYRGLSP